MANNLTLLKKSVAVKGLKNNAPQIPAKRHRLYMRYLFLTMKSLVQASKQYDGEKSGVAQQIKSESS